MHGEPKLRGRLLRIAGPACLRPLVKWQADRQASAAGRPVTPDGRVGDRTADIGGVVGGSGRGAVDLVPGRVPQRALGQVPQQRLLLAEVLPEGRGGQAQTGC